VCARVRPDRAAPPLGRSRSRRHVHDMVARDLVRSRGRSRCRGRRRRSCSYRFWLSLAGSGKPGACCTGARACHWMNGSDCAGNGRPAGQVGTRWGHERVTSAAVWQGHGTSACMHACVQISRCMQLASPAWCMTYVRACHGSASAASYLSGPCCARASGMASWFPAITLQIATFHVSMATLIFALVTASRPGDRSIIASLAHLYVRIAFGRSSVEFYGRFVV
jgi:hypothetical protein